MMRERSAALPLGIVILALLVWSVSVTWTLASDNARLQQARANQEQMVQNSQKLRGSLDTLATETAKLAAQGNPGAKLLIDELAKRGITIKPGS